MRIYLSAPYAARDHLKQLVRELDLDLTCEWLRADHAIHLGTVDAAPDQSDEYVSMRAEGDLADIAVSDAFILFSSWYVRAQWGLGSYQCVSGGRHIETGYALARGAPVVVVGKAENIFHRAMCHVVPTFNEALNYLNANNKEKWHADNPR